MLINNELFKIKDSDIPKIPIEYSEEAREFWREQRKRCIEGYTVGGKWMPGNLYFYINFGTILLNKGTNSKTKIPAKPFLRDIEWEVFRAWSCARGLSGFSNIGIIGETNEDVLERLPNLNEYCGTPMYTHNAKDFMLLGSREFGKSYIGSQGIILHEWLFDGAKEYVPGHTNTTNVIVGAGDLRYATDLISKAKLGYDFLSKEGIMFNNIYHPHPLIKTYDGSFNKEITAKYKKKVGGKWLEYGSMSKIKIVSYKDNPYAGQGSRNSVMVKEECFGKGTEVVMSDLSYKKIEDIVVNDYVMGLDGNPKRVVKTITGKSNLYNIKQKKAVDYITTENHYLYLEQRCKSKAYKDDGIHYVTPLEFNKKDIYRKRTTYGVRASVLNFKEKDINIDPYYLGLWLGDGNKVSTCIYNTDSVIRDWLKDLAKKLKLNYREVKIKNKNTYRCTIVNEQDVFQNHLLKQLQYYNLIKNKHIPKDFMLNSEEIRLEVLAGLIDSDGYLVRNKNKKAQCYEISSYKDLGEDILLLAKSLGFSTYFKEYATYYRIMIRGNIERIPVKLERKKCFNIRTQTAMTSPIVVESIGIGDYYGIQLEAKCEEDKLFLLKDFTIVHNCGMFSNLIAAQEADLETMKSGTNKFGSCYYSGTGGDFGKGTIDAYRMCYDPETYNLISIEDRWEGKGRIIFFIPATMRPNEFKDEHGNTKWDDATLFFLGERERLRNSKNGLRALEAHVQYNPLVPSEMFLRSSGNIFPTTEIKEHLAELETNSIYRDAEMVCELIFNSEGKVEPRLDSQLEPIREFPMSGKSNQDTSGAIVIWHHPELDGNGEVPYGRYYLSLDPYRQEEAGRGASLGSIFVYDSIADTLCAEYTGRPATLDKFYERCRKLALYYNGQILYENEVTGTKQHFEHKNSLHLLMFQPEYIKDVIPGSKVERTYGIHMVDKLKDHGLLLLRDWLQDEYEPGKMNLRKIRSVPLLQELVLFDFDTNVDRISSMIVMMYAIKENHKQFVNEHSTINKFKDPFFSRPLFSRR